MKCWLAVLICCSFFACKNSSKKTYVVSPKTSVLNYDSALKKIDSHWFYKGILFTGFVTEVERNGSIVYKLPVVNGLENGVAVGFYNSGEKLLERNFIAGKKEGLFTQWWPNGNKRYAFIFKDDVLDGEQIVFFPDGNKRQESHYLNGEEEGVQRVWDNTGQLISNYTIKNKKLYGVIKVKSCINTLH